MKPCLTLCVLFCTTLTTSMDVLFEPFICLFCFQWLLEGNMFEAMKQWTEGQIPMVLTYTEQQITASTALVLWSCNIALEPNGCLRSLLLCSCTGVLTVFGSIFHLFDDVTWFYMGKCSLGVMMCLWCMYDCFITALRENLLYLTEKCCKMEWILVLNTRIMCDLRDSGEVMCVCLCMF